jgi:hypothetical protein
MAHGEDSDTNRLLASEAIMFDHRPMSRHLLNGVGC